MPTVPHPGKTATPAKARGGGQWWVVATVGGGPGPRGSLASGVIIVQGTAAAVHAKYDGAAQGPYPSQAAAKAAAQQGASSGSLSNNPSAASPLSTATGLFGIGHWVGVLVTNLTNVNMWKALGWIALGGLLVALGLLNWLRGTETFQGLSRVAGEAALAA